jgi:hypothetical protein
VEEAILKPAYKDHVDYDSLYGYPWYFDAHWDKKIPDSFGTSKVWDLEIIR